MRKLKWLLLIFLFLAPLIVAVAQISVLEFPANSYINPYPQVILDPIRFGFWIAALSMLTSLFLGSTRFRKLSNAFRITLLLFTIIVNLFVFWIGINLGQRAVISGYLSAIDANGFDFLILFMSILTPIPYSAPYGSRFYDLVPFVTVIVVGLVGLIGIIVNHILLFKQKEKVIT